MLKCHKNKKPAFGLIEILISLAIFALAIISITSTNAKTYRIVKNNELADFSNRTMVKTLEFFKAPTTDSLVAGIQQSTQKIIENALINNPPNPTKSVTFKSNSIIDTNAQLTFQEVENNPISKIITCDSGSTYKVAVSPNSGYTGFDLCNQIIIEKKNDGYLIRSRIVYQIREITKINELIGYRPFTYD